MKIKDSKKIIQKKKMKKLKMLHCTKTELSVDTGQSLGSRLLSLAQSLQSGGISGSQSQLIFKLATQVLTSPACTALDESLATCLVRHLLCRSSAAAAVGAAELEWESDRSQRVSPQQLLPFARLAVLRLAPQDELHLPSLLLFKKILDTHPGVCQPVRHLLEAGLRPWLNVPPVDLAARGLVSHWVGRGVRAAAATAVLAGDVYAALPVGGAAGDDNNNSSSNNNINGISNSSSVSKASGAAAARGRQLQQLLLTLQRQLDGLLADVVTAQDTTERPSDLPAGVTLITFTPITTTTSHTNKKQDVKREKERGCGKGPYGDTGLLQEVEEGGGGGEDEDLTPLHRVEAGVCRCCALLLFAERLLHHCGGGGGVTVGVGDVLVPVVRILQVSVSSLRRYSSTETRRLALLWPSLQRAALRLLLETTALFQGHLSMWLSHLQTQLTAALLSDNITTTTTPTQRRNLSDNSAKGLKKKRLDAASEGLLTKKRKTGGGGLEEGAVSCGPYTQDTTQGQPGEGGDAAQEEWMMVSRQEVVRLIYVCLCELAKVTVNQAGTPLPLMEAVLADITPQPLVAARLRQSHSKKAIVNMTIKKKSKRRGYSILPATATSTEDRSVSSPSPALCPSFSGSSAVVSAALDYLREVLECSAHYTLSCSTAALLCSALLRLCRQCADGAVCPSEQVGAMLPHGCLPSTSGRVDVRALLLQPALLGRLFGLLSSLVVNYHPACPASPTEVTHVLQRAIHVHRSSSEVVASCRAGLNRVQLFLSCPRVSIFFRQVEEAKAVAAAGFASSSQAELDGRAEEYQAADVFESESEEEEEEEEIVQSDSHDSEEIDESISKMSEDDERESKRNEHDENVNDIDNKVIGNGAVEVNSDGESDVEETREEEDEVTNSECESKTLSYVGKCEREESFAEEDVPGVTDSTTVAVLKKKSKKKKNKALQNESIKKKKKKKKQIVVAQEVDTNSSAAAGPRVKEVKLQTEETTTPGDDESEEADLTVDEMLAELMD